MRDLVLGIFFLTLGLLGELFCTPAWPQSAVGGFVEPQGSAARTPPLTGVQIAAFMPATRGSFTFPAPYNTKGYRITQPSDCGGQDCVEYIGYSYWPMMNAHQQDNFLYIVIALRNTRGGTGLTLFTLNKTTGTVTKVGNLFPASLSSFQTSVFSETWYFSFDQPYTLYLTDFVSLLKYNVQTQAMTTAFTILNRSYTPPTGPVVSFGCTSSSCQRRVHQCHSVASDTIHTCTLINTSGAESSMGCLVYNSTTDVFRFYPTVGIFDECAPDRTGQYTLVLEQNVPTDVANRIFDNTTALEVATKNGPTGTLGHYALGYGYALGTDNNGAEPLPNTSVRYSFPSGTPTTVIFSNNDPPPTPPVWEREIMSHPSHNNAVSTSVLPLADQIFCGSQATPVTSFRTEIMCARVDGANPKEQLVVAPVMTTMAAGFGGYWNNAEYGQQPKGHLDVTGRYFLWTTNFGGSRLDAVIAEVPSQLLTGDLVGPQPPTGVQIS